jgi:hypothetical protein
MQTTHTQLPVPLLLLQPNSYDNQEPRRRFRAVESVSARQPAPPSVRLLPVRRLAGPCTPMWPVALLPLGWLLGRPVPIYYLCRRRRHITTHLDASSVVDQWLA